MPDAIEHLVAKIRDEHFAFPGASSDDILLARSRGVPEEMLNFYSICDGAYLGAGDDFLAPDGRRFRVAISRLSVLQTTPEFGYIFQDSPLYAASMHWWQIVDYGDSNRLAFDAASNPPGRIIDVCHETVGEPGYQDIVASTLKEYLEQALVDAVFWMREDFEPIGAV